MRAAALILAAGESRRMGFPKALLRYQDETFVDHLIGLYSAYCSPVIVVLGASAGRIRAAIQRPAVIVENPDFALGQTTSMQCGLRAVPSDAEGVLFTLVDHPAVSAATVERLLTPPMPLVRVPRYGEKRGHPIWFSRDLIPEFLALGADGAAREVVRSHVEQTGFVDVDDAGVVADIDDPESYSKLTGAAL